MLALEGIRHKHHYVCDLCCATFTKGTKITWYIGLLADSFYLNLGILQYLGKHT